MGNIMDALSSKVQSMGYSKISPDLLYWMHMDAGDDEWRKILVFIQQSVSSNLDQLQVKY